VIIIETCCPYEYQKLVASAQLKETRQTCSK
jgi:hypothetical protein